MPGDPKECREHAKCCLRMAAAASSPMVRDNFLSLAHTWSRLARELEASKRFLESKATFFRWKSFHRPPSAHRWNNHPEIQIISLTPVPYHSLASGFDQELSQCHGSATSSLWKPHLRAANCARFVGNSLTFAAGAKPEQCLSLFFGPVIGAVSGRFQSLSVRNHDLLSRKPD